MVFRSLIPALVAVSLCVAAPAQAFIASNGLVVQRESGTTFYVPWRGLSGDTHFWCAAGQFVRRGMGMMPNTRIYRMSEPPRRQGEGIRFSLSPEGAATRSGVMVFGGPDASVSAAMAETFCPRIPRMALF